MKFDTHGWFLDRGRFGGLHGILIAPRNSAPSLLVTLCHGFGAPGTDLVPLVEEIVPRMRDGIAPPAFFFPEGPIDLAEAYGMQGANAWWPLNMAMLGELAASDQFDALFHQVPPGLIEAEQQLAESIAHCAQSKQWGQIPHVLGGFSQGSMLAIDTALHATGLDVRGLIVWSGALICADRWKYAYQNRPQPVRVYQSHGTQDPILPIGAGRALRDLLDEFQWPIEWVEFQGPHTIPEPAIDGAVRLIESIVNDVGLTHA